MDIALGATVVTADGDEVGKVDLVLVDLRTNVVSHVVLAGAGPAAERKAVPIWAIERGEAASLYLEAETAALDRLPSYQPGRDLGQTSAQAPGLAHEPGEYPSLFPEDGSLPAESVALGEGTAVTCHEHRVGKLVGLVSDDYTAETTTLVVQLAEPAGRMVDVPIGWARSLTHQRVRLECNPGDLRSLPESELQTA